MHSVPAFMLCYLIISPISHLKCLYTRQAFCDACTAGHIRILLTFFGNLTTNIKTGYGKINYVSGLMIWSENSHG